MKRYLMRCSVLPYTEIKAIDMMQRDRTGTNNGNLLYQYSVAKHLLTEDTIIEADGYSIDPSKSGLINARYDAYIIPLADAFRKDFRKYLKAYTQLINKLTIPVYVIGVGLRATVDFYKDEKFEFDDDVVDFIKAVLNRSGTIGTRGEITSQYLSRLGFLEGKDHRVIGCPSLYSFGSELEVRDINLTSDSLVTINADPGTSPDAMRFLDDFARTYPKATFIPQGYKEFVLTYFGNPSIASTSKHYPSSNGSNFYSNGNVRFFLSANEWLEYMKSVDFSIGTRLHGNIAATLSETPNLTIIRDSRMMELAQFHGMPSVFERDICDLNPDLSFDKFHKKQKPNYSNFINFLKNNDLPHIKENEMENCPFNKKVAACNYPGPVLPVPALSSEERMERLADVGNLLKI